MQILDRKNIEIEDLKFNYRIKVKDLEEIIGKLERKSNQEFFRGIYFRCIVFYNLLNR